MIVKILLGVTLGFVLYSVWYHKDKSPANDWIETSWAETGRARSNAIRQSQAG